MKVKVSPPVRAFLQEVTNFFVGSVFLFCILRDIQTNGITWFFIFQLPFAIYSAMLVIVSYAQAARMIIDRFDS